MTKPRHRTRTPRGILLTAGAVATAALSLGLSASALAAHPKTGKRYSGFSSEPKLLGFGAPLSFRVSADGTKLLNFTYTSLGCFGAGGFKPGVSPFKSPYAIQKLGTVAVAKNGHFSVKNAKGSYTFPGGRSKIITTTTVTGQFKTARTATGTVTFTQQSRFSHSKPGSCGPADFTFSAKAG
jgi:hypothetical protein